MDKERKMLYAILGALAALAAAAAVVLTLKKRKCAQEKLFDEIDDMVALEPENGSEPECACAEAAGAEECGEQSKEAAE